MQCYKQFSITVEEMAALFTWPAATLIGSTAFFPENTTGDTAIAFANGNLIDGPANSNNTGSLTWNSNAILPVNMHVITATTGALPDPDILGAIGVYVVAPFSQLLTVNAGVHIGYNDTADFPFNFPNTGGADWVIEWFHKAFVAPNPNNSGTHSITGTFTVV